MGQQSEQVLGLGVLRAATKAVNLCFAGIMATSSVVLQSWSLFGVSLAGYATLVVWDLTRVGFWKRVINDMRTRPPALPEPDEVADPGARHFVNRLQSARLETRRVLEGMRGPVPRRVVSQLEVMPEVEKRALVLIERLEEVSRYLADKNVRGLRNEVERLRRACENTSSDRLRVEYKKAHAALTDELHALEEIGAAKDLLMAKLETLAGSLEMFPCQIVRQRVIDAEAHEPTEEPAFDPRMLADDGATFEGVLTEVEEPPPLPKLFSPLGGVTATGGR
jgi:hypothetical protein